MCNSKKSRTSSVLVKSMCNSKKNRMLSVTLTKYIYIYIIHNT